MKNNTKFFFENGNDQKLILEEESLMLERRVFDDQVKRMESKDPKFIVRRGFVELFIEAFTDLGLKNNRGQRDNSRQSNFKTDLMIKMNSKHSKSKVDKI